jgi:hypothetical protein
LLGAVQGASTQEIKSIKDGTIAAAKALAGTLTCPPKKTDTVSGRITENPDATAAVYAVGDTTLHGDYICGVSKVPVTGYDCPCECAYSCSITFSIQDMFQDVLDIFDWVEGNQDIPGGIPYAITGSWKDIVSGKCNE